VLLEGENSIGVKSIRRRGRPKPVEVIIHINNLLKQGKYDEIISCRVPKLPGTVDQKITFKSTNEGINVEVEYLRKWWTKPVSKYFIV
jgi:hypothetical protein